MTYYLLTMENLIYYIALYLFVILVRFFKLKKQYGMDGFREKWKETFFSSLDIVYSASGFVIALLLNVPKTWIAVVIIMYIILVVSAACMEMSGDSFKTNSKLAIHLFIIALIATATIISYSNLIPTVDFNGNNFEKDKATDRIEEEYIVAIPYVDYSLISHIGYNKLKDKNFLFEISVRTSNKDSALILAINKINSDSLIRPILPNKSKENINLLPEKALILKKSDIK